MTMPDKSMGDRSRDEVLAGEYVLGVLGDQARREVEARMLRDRQFAAIVHRWEENLAGFDDDYVAITPPPQMRARIETRLFTVPAIEPPGAVGRLWNSLGLWRALAFASIGALLVIGGQYVALLVAPQSDRLVASMSGTGSSVALLADFDQAAGLLRVIPVAGGNQGQKSLQLWLVEDDHAPRPLGLLPDAGGGELVVPAELRTRFAAGAVLAVSVEPFGGSPTGNVTGPVIVSGPLGVQARKK